MAQESDSGCDLLFGDQEQYVEMLEDGSEPEGVIRECGLHDSGMALVHGKQNAADTMGEFDAE